MLIRQLVHHNTYLYFIQMDNTGPIKIGTARDPWKRFQGLKTGSPYKVKMLYFTPATLEDERENQYRYRKFRLEGEWFLPHPKILNGIEGLKKQDKKHGWFYENYNPKTDLDKQNQIILGEDTKAWDNYINNIYREGSI
jgi:hypothetical protein